MRDSRINLIRFTLLFTTAIALSLWIENFLPEQSLRLPKNWESTGGLVQNVPGGLKMPPGQQISFSGLQFRTDHIYELEVFLKVEEFGRVAVGIGPQSDCSAFEIETSLAFSGSVMPPSRINMVFDTEGYVIYYENGKPVRKIAAGADDAGCFSLKSLDSVLTLTGFRETSGQSQTYRQRFLLPPKVTLRILPVIISLLAVLGFFVLIEWRIVLNSPETTSARAAASMAIHIAPLLVTSSLSLVWGWSIIAVWPALAWFVFSRLRFACRYARFFDASEKSARKIQTLLIWVNGSIVGLSAIGHFSGLSQFGEDSPSFGPIFVILLGCNLTWVFLYFSHSKPRLHKVATTAAAIMTVAGILAAASRLIPYPYTIIPIGLAISFLPFGALCLLARHGKPVRFYGLWMFLLSILFLLSIEAGLQLSPLGDRLKPMNMAEDYEKHDLLLWVPMDFFSEDGQVQVQNYSIPRINFRSGSTSPKKPDDLYRIAVLGGSNTWGDGIENPESVFSEVLERRLNERKTKKFQVINAGVKGYASLQVFVLLKHYIADYNPDMAIFYILRNDLVQNWGIYTMREMYRMATSKKLSAVRKAQNTLAQFGLYNGFSDMLVTFRQELSASTGKKFNLKPVKTDEDFCKNLVDIANVCREKGIVPVFVVEYQSADHALGYEYRVTDLERHMVDYADRLNVPLLNANQYFYTRADWREMVLPHDWVHLNENGHKQVGQLIADFLVEQKLVP